MSTMASQVEDREELELIIRLRNERADRELRRWFRRLRRRPVALVCWRTWTSSNFRHIWWRWTHRVDLP